MKSERKVILYIAMSVDGYIAGPDDDLSFLNRVATEGEDYGYGAFTAGVDTIIMGRKTFDWVMKQVPEFPHEGKDVYIITGSQKPARGSIQFYSGSIAGLITALKEKNGKNIFIDGGAELVDSMLKEGLLDEMIISIIPNMVGNGTPLFKPGRNFQSLNLISSKSFDSGLVQLHYTFTG